MVIAKSDWEVLYQESLQGASCRNGTEEAISMSDKRIKTASKARLPRSLLLSDKNSPTAEMIRCHNKCDQK